MIKGGTFRRVVYNPREKQRSVAACLRRAWTFPLLFRRVRLLTPFTTDRYFVVIVAGNQRDSCRGNGGAEEVETDGIRFKASIRRDFAFCPTLGGN